MAYRCTINYAKFKEANINSPEKSLLDFSFVMACRHGESVLVEELKDMIDFRGVKISKKYLDIEKLIPESEVKAVVEKSISDADINELFSKFWKMLPSIITANKSTNEINEVDGFQILADSLRDWSGKERIKDYVTFESFIEGISKHLCIRNFGLRGGAWECEKSDPPLGVCKECWKYALSRKYKE